MTVPAGRSVPRTAVVVGAGLGGLAAACHLAGAGHDVTVVESAPVPGGRAGVAVRAGYHFDTGPTVLTMPHLVRRCFEAAGVEMDDLLALVPVDPMYRATFPDGSELRVRHGRGPMAEEIRAVCGPAEAGAFEEFCAWLERLYRVEMPGFIERNYDGPLDLVRPLGPAIELVRLGAFGRLSRAVARRFRDDRLRRIFSFQAMYAGLAPYEALAIYAVITYMDVVNGVVVPVGGMHALPQAMAAAAARAGAAFRYGTPVERILLAEGTSGPVRGVRLAGGEVLAADAVVCNADLPVAYRTLLPGLEAPRAARRGRYSPSALVWHVGARGDLPPGVAHHNIHFGEPWEAAFRAVLDGGRRMPEPSYLVSVPSVTEPALAPPGRHVIFALEPVPNLDGRVDWTAERGRARDGLAAALATHGYPVDAEVEELVDPLDWEARGMERGTPFALAHTFRQTGPFRPPNVDRRAPGLVFTGSGTVPGVGIPMVLVSGMLAARRVVAGGTG
ncbi:MAG TPA: phytoene desaturase family protein [Acidimicrobiales bacterium]